MTLAIKMTNKRIIAFTTHFIHSIIIISIKRDCNVIT